MKIIATNNYSIIIDDKDTWILYNDGVNKKIYKKDHSEWYHSMIAKWGFIPIDPIIEIEIFNNITNNVLQKVFSSFIWERDYLS
jgi:hypothetical protein